MCVIDSFSTRRSGIDSDFQAPQDGPVNTARAIFDALVAEVDRFNAMRRASSKL